MKKSLFSVALLATFALGAGLAAGQGSSPTPHKAPEIAFTVPGQGERLLSQYRGKVVVLDFILTTCPHCQAAAHTLSGLQQKYGSQGFQALQVAINGTDEGRNQSQANDLVSAFARTYQANFPVGWVARDAMPTFMGFSLMDRTVVPQVVIIDRKGFIRYQTPATGESDLRMPDVLQQHVEELLSAGSAASHRTPAAKTAAKQPS
ncbi:MAG TPA: TlpA disulfide reductase family protein [Bryobacteraceae bacterium]|nr:TlpA disulfide reductase family protein [Bryobacteraceae bacterium]